MKGLLKILVLLSVCNVNVQGSQPQNYKRRTSQINRRRTSQISTPQIYNPKIRLLLANNLKYPYIWKELYHFLRIYNPKYQPKILSDGHAIIVDDFLTKYTPIYSDGFFTLKQLQTQNDSDNKSDEILLKSYLTSIEAHFDELFDISHPDQQALLDSDEIMNYLEKLKQQKKIVPKESTWDPTIEKYIQHAMSVQQRHNKAEKNLQEELKSRKAKDASELFQALAKEKRALGRRNSLVLLPPDEEASDVSTIVR